MDTAASAPLRALIVDDHPDAREVLANMVTAMGLLADVAASAMNSGVNVVC
mgnify:CR=1 FL=1